MAKSTSVHSYRVRHIRATRSPGCTPAATRPRATCSTSAANSAAVTSCQRPCTGRAKTTRCGLRSACRTTRSLRFPVVGSGTSAGTENSATGGASLHGGLGQPYRLVTPRREEVVDADGSSVLGRAGSLSGWVLKIGGRWPMPLSMQTSPAPQGYRPARCPECAALVRGDVPWCTACYVRLDGAPLTGPATAPGAELEDPCRAEPSREPSRVEPRRVEPGRADPADVEAVEVDAVDLDAVA